MVELDDDASYEHGVNANVSVDEIVKKDVTNTEVNKFVCIEELSNEDIQSNVKMLAADSLEKANENVNYANKFEVVYGLPVKETSKDRVTSANENIALNIPIHIIRPDMQSPVKDIQRSEFIESEKLPTISTTAALAQGRVS